MSLRELLDWFASGGEGRGLFAYLTLLIVALLLVGTGVGIYNIAEKLAERPKAVEVVLDKDSELLRLESGQYVLIEKEALDHWYDENRLAQASR